MRSHGTPRPAIRSSRGAHPADHRRRPGRSNDRDWYRPALALLVAVLLGSCAWLCLRSGTTGEVPDASWPVDRSTPIRAEPPAEAIRTAATPPERDPAAAIGSADPAAATKAGDSEPESLVHGALLDPAGAPIRDARSAGVSFVDHTGSRHTAEVKPDGSYALHALGSGTHWVTATADGYRSLEQTLDLRPDRLQLRRDFTLQKAVALRIRVTTPAGKNLFDILQASGAPAGARVVVPIATRDPPGKRFEQVTGSLNDKFGVGQFDDHGPRVEPLASGCIGILLLDCDLPVYVSLVHYQRVLQTKCAGIGQDEVSFVIAPDDLLAGLATIRAQVIDAETSRPIQGARVMLRGGTCSDQGVATDPQGIASIDRREPGPFDLEVRANGYERFHRPIDLLPGTVTDLGTVALAHEVTVAGRVIDLEGYPLAASFSLGSLDPADHSIRWFGQGFDSNGMGAFAIPGLGRRQYVIRTSNHDAMNHGAWEGIAAVSGNLLVDTRAGSIAGLEVRLRPAAKLVLHVTGSTADGMRFRVVDEHGLELVGGRFRGAVPRPLALPAGSYRVALLDPDGAVLTERSVMLGADSIELDLAR